MSQIADSVHQLTLWAKARLDEMDASIASMEAHAVTTGDKAELQAHLALMDARKWRQSFRSQAKTLHHAVGTAAAQHAANLDDYWQQFERSFARWADAAGKRVEDLAARLYAQIDGWTRIVAEQKTQVEDGAKEVQEQFRKNVKSLEDTAERQRKHLRELESAGSTTYAAWSEALTQSRAAFDHALQTTQTAFTKDMQ